MRTVSFPLERPVASTVEGDQISLRTLAEGHSSRN